MKAYWGMGYSSTHSLTSALDEVSGQRHELPNLDLRPNTDVLHTPKFICN
jgi:hypothetical protein